LQGGNILVEVVVQGRQAGNHQGVRVSPQRLPQQGR
jgi:hypothetical protein